MPFDFKWPWSNQYTLNLDWIIATMKSYVQRFQEGKIKSYYTKETLTVHFEREVN